MPHQLNESHNGKLIVTVLSAYDLPEDVQPQSVQLEVSGKEVDRTGPPSAKHKERNSFKFTGSGGATGRELIARDKLEILYNGTATLRVSTDEHADFVADFSIHNLRVNESQWIILNLKKKGSSSGRSAEAYSGAAGDASFASSTTTTTTGAVHPHLRLKVRLEGSFRPEVSALMNTSKMWFEFVDSLVGSYDLLELPKNIPQSKYLLIPAVPLAAGAVVLTPVIAGILVVGLPFFLPFLAVLGAFIASVLGLAAIFYFSTEKGRTRLMGVSQPAITTVTATPIGQKIIFDTGPRPSPKTLAQTILPRDMMGKLLVSLAVDFVGSSSYLLPFVGEAFDVAWAPTQAILVAALYDEVTPNLKYVSFAEEILPFTDFVPSATIGWTTEYGPTILNMSQQKVHELIVAARREKDVVFSK